VADERIERAICETLLAQWRAEYVPGDANGRRVFVRLVSLIAGNHYWDDWRLAGYVEGGVSYPMGEDDDEGLRRVLNEQIAAGASSGWLAVGDLYLNWMLTNCPDGPETTRVTDWAGTPGEG
jgi:hypothetical protein